MKKTLILLSLSLIVILAGCKPNNSDIYKSWEKNFDQTSITALKIAKNSLEDFDKGNESNWLKDYDLTNPLITSNIAYDRNNVSHNIWLIAFPEKNNKSWATVYMPLKSDGHFDIPISTSFSIFTKKQILKLVKKIYTFSPAN
jgi:hypothetical protein